MEEHKAVPHTAGVGIRHRETGINLLFKKGKQPKMTLSPTQVYTSALLPDGQPCNAPLSHSFFI